MRLGKIRISEALSSEARAAAIEGCAVVRCEFDHSGGVFITIAEHPDFPEHVPGKPIPEFEAVLVNGTQREFRRREDDRFFVGEDDDGHRYLVPVRMQREWTEWSALHDDDERKWTPPAGIRRFEGKLEFERPGGIRYTD